ncbi:hypothetical protein BaRGS_00009505 [Batillaria attramentaria]|uniref:Uncharacterized protein n=1 Tax=Batillaria attramentaria TaxID=370345 RepID=A0ABD0LIP4_9CAEN|nr:hypothetical protein BaRGS_021215 [Batillaria attramentaria]
MSSRSAAAKVVKAVMGASDTVTDSDNNKKRHLSLSPSADHNESKKSKAVGVRESLDELVAEARGMDKEMLAASSVDTNGIHETILTRVNKALTQSTMADTNEGENKFLRQVVPALVTAVSVAVSEAINHIFRQREKDMPDQHRLQCTMDKLQSNMLRLKYENDALQQYSRRETVRIFGIPEQATGTRGDGDEDDADAAGGGDVQQENLQTKVLSIFRDCGADIKPEDISVVHRTGRRSRGGGRPVLVRFVSRRHHREVMSKKKAQKNKGGYEKVFINEDLTNLRVKLLHYTRDLPTVERAWTSNGKIWAVRKRPPGSTPNSATTQPISIENPDDLFKLGVSTVSYKDLGLDYLLA